MSKRFDKLIANIKNPTPKKVSATVADVELTPQEAETVIRLTNERLAHIESKSAVSNTELHGKVHALLTELDSKYGPSAHAAVYRTLESAGLINALLNA